MPIGSMDTLETISAGKSKIRAPTPNIFASVWHRFEENIMGRLATILGLWDSGRPQNSGNSSITVFVRKLQLGDFFVFVAVSPVHEPETHVLVLESVN